MLLCLFPVFTTADGGQCGDDLTWSFDAATGKLTITGSGPMNYEGNAPWNDLKDQITSLSLPDGLTTVHNSAFSTCSGLTTLTIPESVTSIGRSAFSNCTGLTSLTMPCSAELDGFSFEEVKDIATLHLTAGTGYWNIGHMGNAPWYRYNSYGKLTTLILDEGILEIGAEAFCGCDITSVTIPRTVKTIGKKAFIKCDGITTLTVPGNVKTIGEEAFSSCTGLTSLTLENGVTTIGSYAFGSCVKLTSLVIPDSVKTLGESAFVGCDRLATVTIGSGVTSFGNLAFFECAGLATLTIKNGVTSIGDKAFQSCTKLTSVVIPATVTSIGNDAFYKCSGFASVTFKGATAIGSYAFGGCSKLTSLDLGAALSSIGKGAFDDCIGLTAVTIPNSVTAIPELAFSDCTGLTAITIPTSVDTIGNKAFLRCTALQNVYYQGTREEKEQIAIGDDNDCLLNAAWWYNGEVGPDPVAPPTIKTQPKDAKVKIGAKTKFKVKATGKNVTYQWYYRTSEDGEWILIDGATAATYTVTATAEKIGWQYRCLAKNADGEAYSNPATLRQK